MRILRVREIIFELTGFTVKMAQAVARADPDAPVLVFQQRPDAIISQAVGIVRVVHIETEFSGAGIINIQAARVRANPDQSIA